MTIESWLPALLGILIPVGLFLLAWGGMESERARRSTTVGALALALGTLGYFAIGFAFHLGGAGLLSDQPGLTGLTRLFAGQGDLDWGLIGLAGFFLGADAATPQAYALFFTYLPLVVSAVLLTALSMSGRARGWQTLVGGLLTSAMLFPLAACWAWGGGWLAKLGLTLERGHGFVDYSGSGVVYLLGGCAALGTLLGLGYRLPPASPDEPEEMPPAHFPLLANLGALLFGLGWLGWSLSAPFHVAGAGLNLPRLAVNGLLAAAGAILTSQTYCWFTAGHADPLMSARGTAAGFMALAAGAPFVSPWAALVVGAVAGLLLPLGVYLVERVLRLPDATATVALGTTSGAWGLLAVGLFADGRSGQGWNGIGPTEYHTVLGQGVTGFIPAAGFIGDGRGQIVAQLAGLGAIALLALLVGWLASLALTLPYRWQRARAAREQTTGRAEEPEEEPSELPQAAAEAEESQTPPSDADIT
jgi:Amt family ammonium transporter